MKCKICGKEEHPEYFYISKELEKHQMCFECNFWRKMLKDDKNRPSHQSVIIDGTHYIISDENSSDAFRGFGGQKFEIVFNDGTKVTTTNLWCQGKPSEWWIDKFKDNAKFNNLK